LLDSPEVPARERLLSAFDVTPLMQPRATAKGWAVVRGFAQRLADVAREAGARDPDRLGEQLALLNDGVAARSVALNTLDTARQIAEILLDTELPTPRKSTRACR
jgi:hypothetical protein